MSIKAVIFDLDNTLTHRDLSIQVFAGRLFEHYKSQIINADQSSYEQILRIIRYIDNGGYPKLERLTIPTIGGSVADQLIKQLTWSLTPSLDELTAFWFDQFGLNAVAMPDAENVLNKLKNFGLKLAVISNGGHATRLKILEGLGFKDFFDEIVSSESAGISKPNAEIFLKTCEKLNVHPNKCLYVGDHPINDYFGAKQAGLNAIFLEGFHLPVEDQFPPIEDTIQSLPQILDFINSSEKFSNY